MLPIRCFSCGKVTASLSKRYQQLVSENVPKEEIFKRLGLTRYCCRAVILTHVDNSEELLKYEQLPRVAKE